MNRRKALRYTGYVTGLALGAPLFGSLVSGCTTDHGIPELTYKPEFLDPEQLRFVAAIAETMFPKTSDMPGAVDVEVYKYVDLRVSQTYNTKWQERFRSGLAAFMETAQAAAETSFADQSAADRLAYLNPIDEEVRALLTKWAEEPPQQDEEEADTVRYSFFGDLKGLIIEGFYQSEPIATQFLVYNPVPGEYDPCMPLEETDGKAWALG